MTEETQTPAPAPKRRPFSRRKTAPGNVAAAADRAAAMPRATNLLSKMKAKPNWDSDDYIGVGHDGADRLRIDPEIVQALYRDGVALQWITRSVRGQETPREVSNMTKAGWTPVHQADFDGLLDGMFLSKGLDEFITVDDCMLVARPADIQRQARRAEFNEATRPLEIAEEQIGHGIPGVTGSTHRSVRNSIKKSIERVEIPE